MIIEGVKLMFVGMGTVFLFLLLMISLLNLVARITRKHTAREYEAIEIERKLLAAAAKAKKQKTLAATTVMAPRASADDEDDIVVIAAAIAAFEAGKMQHC